MMSETINAQLRDAFQRAQSVLIVSHIRPDGDAIGSLLGLGLSLQTAGKQVQMVLADGVPASFRQLPGAAQVRRKVQGGPFDLAVVVDCSDLLRTGTALGERSPDINIDHHITNLGFARINLVDADAQATSGILAEHLESWGLTVTEPVAKALLTGLVSDTIGFRTSNVTSNTLRLAAWLMDHGANLAELYNRAIVRRSFEAAQYWGQGLNKLQRDGRMLWTTLSLADRSAASYTGNDDADLINVISAIDETDIGLIFIEQHDNHVKVSWRAQPGWDVSQLALSFGGGGHPAAAGADIAGSLAEVQARVLESTRQVLAGGENGKKNHNNGKEPVKAG
jgi:bifunctional oligoribonuclease and PAP phosphatase NrnA